MAVTIYGLDNEPELSRYLNALARWKEAPDELLAKAVTTRYMECVDAGWQDESLTRLARSFGWYAKEIA